MWIMQIGPKSYMWDFRFFRVFKVQFGKARVFSTNRMTERSEL